MCVSNSYLQTILMDAQMLLTQDLYYNVLCVHGYSINSVAYTFLWNLWRILVSIQEKVIAINLARCHSGKTMLEFPEIYRRKKKK